MASLKINYALLSVVILLIVFTVVGFYIPLVLGEDPGTGFAIWNSMRNGAAFNTFLTPSPNNLLQDIALFVTWWTPGQYWIPGTFSQLFGTALGTAGVWVTLIFSAVGLWGWYQIYKILGFRSEIVALSIFLIASSRLFTINFLNYTGGEVLIFGGQPWVIWWYLKYKHRFVIFLIGLVVLSLLCFFFKSAHTIGLAALCICGGLSYLRILTISRKFKNPYFVVCLTLGLGTLLYLFITNFLFLTKGTNPSSSISQPFRFNVDSLEILTYPFNQWLNFSDIYLQLLKKDIISPNAVLYWGMLVGCLAVQFWIVKNNSLQEAKMLFWGLYVGYFAIFLVVYNKGADISIEYRHVKTVAYAFLPLLVNTMMQSAWYKRVLLTAVLLLNSGYGIASYVLKKQEINKHYVTGIAGFKLREATHEDISYIQEIDQPQNILWFTMSSLSVESQKARKIITGFDFNLSRAGGFVFDRYHGKGPKIYACFHQLYGRDPAVQLSGMFDQYEFKKVKQTSNYIFFEGEPSTKK